MQFNELYELCIARLNMYFSDEEKVLRLLKQVMQIY